MTIDPKALPEIHERDIRPCDGCGQHIIQTGMTFWIGEVSRGILDMQGLKERVGLTMMMGGSSVLGSMFAGTPAARRFDGPTRIIVCEGCACSVPLAVLVMRPDEETAAETAVSA